TKIVLLKPPPKATSARLTALGPLLGAAVTSRMVLSGRLAAPTLVFLAGFHQLVERWVDLRIGDVVLGHVELLEDGLVHELALGVAHAPVPLLQVAEEVECVLQQRSSGVAAFGRLRQLTFDASALVTDLFEFGLHILRRCFANGDEVDDVVLSVSSC